MTTATTTTPCTTIELNDEAAVIKITPWVPNAETGYTPHGPVLVIQTCAGELEFSYNPERNRFSVVGRKLRFRGMPAGTTMYAHRDEASYHGGDIERLWDLTRVPRWSVSGSDRRSDGHEPTRTMVRNCQAHLEYVTTDCGKTHEFKTLVEITMQWDARRRACALKAEISAMQARLAELDAAILADRFPV